MIIMTMYKFDKKNLKKTTLAYFISTLESSYLVLHLSLFSLLLGKNNKNVDHKKSMMFVCWTTILCHGFGFHVWVQTSQVKLMFFVSTVAAAAASSVDVSNASRSALPGKPKFSGGKVVVEDGCGWRGRCQGVG